MITYLKIYLSKSLTSQSIDESSLSEEKKRNIFIFILLSGDVLQTEIFQLKSQPSVFVMASKNRDEIISRFIAITQCSSKDAAEYLESANWNEQAAVDFFFDSVASQVPDPTPSIKTRSSEVKPTKNVPGMYLCIYHSNKKRGCLFFFLLLTIGKTEPNETNAYESDDDLLQNALEESLRLKPPEKSPDIMPKRFDNNKSIISSKISNFDNFKKNKDDSDDDDDDDDDEGN